jgi:hypothetical protein
MNNSRASFTQLSNLSIMSKIACECGHIIVDQTDYLSYKGDIIPDIFQELLFEKLNTGIVTFIDAIKNGQKEKWIKETFLDSYPLDLDNSNMISDLFYMYYSDHKRIIYQCENCGRVLIQKGKSDHFASFKPESDDWRNILGKEE